MGVPGFFRYLCENFSDCVCQFSPLSGSGILCLDLNAIIHPVCQRVYGYGEQSVLSKRKKKDDVKITPEYTYEQIIKQLEDYRHDTKPEIIIDTIDGVSGMAKLLQQRKRRFTSETPKQFNTNSISLGTEFLYNFGIYTEKYLRKITLDSVDGLKKSLLSTDQCSGEGEHKLIWIIKELYTFWKVWETLRNRSIYVLSSDADLTMICLCLNEWFYTVWLSQMDERKEKKDYKSFIPNIYVIRVYKSDIHIIDITKLSSKIKKLGISVYDFIFLCFFIGNDFLPHTPCIDIYNSGIERLLSIRLRINVPLTYVDKKVKINQDHLLLFLRELQKSECSWIKERLNDKNLEYKDEIWEKYPHRNYAIEYNKQYLHGKKNDACKNYVRGLGFVLEYYTNMIPCWDWCYVYAFSPFIKNVISYLEKRLAKKGNIFSPFSGKRKRKLTRIEQLMCILPERSISLLPKECQSFVTDNKEYTEFKVIRSGIHKDYEQVVDMKCQSYDMIRKHFKKLILSKDTKKKNEEGKIIMIS